MSLPLIIKDIEDRFKISGGTLTGNVEINKSSYPTIMIKDLGQGRRGEFIYNINEEVIISNYKDENNRSLLFLRNENNVNNSLQLSRVVDGQWSNYNIYGEHNKPTAADVGALSLNGGTISGKLGISYTSYTKMPEVNRTDNNEVGIVFSHGGIKNGTFGFSDDKPFVRLGDSILSTDNKYLYGEHNKPTPADIGAPTVTGSGASGTWPISISGSATKLSSARNIALGGDLTGSANFDGSGNITINGYEYNCSVSGSNTYNYPWHRIATIPALSNTYNDRECIIMIRHAYDGGGVGLAKISVRSNLNSNGTAKIIWLYRYNIQVDALQMGFINTAGKTQGDVYYKVSSWPRCTVYQTQGGRNWTLISSSEVSDTTTSDKKTSYEVYTSVADGGSKLGKSYTHTIVAVDNSHPTSSGTSSMTANSSSLATSNVYLQYV